EEGYAVDEAADGDEALFKATSWAYDAIVLDVMLPVLDGFKVLERLRKRKSTPVLFLTARDAVDDLVRGLDAGGDDYLVKPFDFLGVVRPPAGSCPASQGQGRRGHRDRGGRRRHPQPHGVPRRRPCAAHRPRIWAGRVACSASRRGRHAH